MAQISRSINDALHDLTVHFLHSQASHVGHLTTLCRLRLIIYLRMIEYYYAQLWKMSRYCIVLAWRSLEIRKLLSRLSFVQLGTSHMQVRCVTANLTWLFSRIFSTYLKTRFYHQGQCSIESMIWMTDWEGCRRSWHILRYIIPAFFWKDWEQRRNLQSR
jgi:Na+-transporting NADH:ubiquinone oxidoreductase subunit NqrB